MKTLTGAATALLLSTVAFAQPAHMGGPPSPMMAGEMPMMGMMMGGHCAMMRRSEGALAFLKTELKITAAQDKAWGAFADAYRTEAASRSKGPAHGGAMGGPGGMMIGSGEPFPKAVDTHLRMMERHLASARKLSDAAKPLYDALSADQRKTADELLTHFVMMRCPM